MNNDFAKTLKNYSIIYLPELPSKDLKVEENTVIAVPAEEKDKFKLYTWFENKWVLTTTIYKSDFDLKDLKDIYNDLNNAVNKLTKISANTESNEMFLKLGKITNKVLQAMYELARAEQQQEYFEHQLEESLKDYNKEQNGL